MLLKFFQQFGSKVTRAIHPIFFDEGAVIVALGGDQEECRPGIWAAICAFEVENLFDLKVVSSKAFVEVFTVNLVVLQAEVVDVSFLFQGLSGFNQVVEMLH